MGQEFVVLEGKTFTIELQSMLGSSNFGWCLDGLPSGILMMGEDKIPTKPGIAPVIQRFYFGVNSAGSCNVEINFVLASHFDVTKIADTYTAQIRIVPSNCSNFTPFSENAMVNNRCLSEDTQAGYKYGYPCVQSVAEKYGYPCGVNDAALKYGYPCAANDAAFKYGYPCSADDTALKYGYPCGVNDAALKYGYPCNVNDAAKDARPYGMIYNGMPGEPLNNSCDMREISKATTPYGVFYNGNSNQLYGYYDFTGEAYKDVRAYAFPYNESGCGIKYGYMGCC